MAEEPREKSIDSGRARPDTSGDFFSVGAPLHAVRAAYIKRRADDLLYEALIAGRYAHVLAPDRSGKSSLIAATAARLESNGFNVAVLDLEQIGFRDGGTDGGRWHYSVAYRMLRQLRIRYDLQDWWQDKSVLSHRQRLVEFYSEVILPNLQGQVVIFVDGIQFVRELPFEHHLLASIRAAQNARNTDPEYLRLTFVLLGECDPGSLVDVAEASPFHNTQLIALDDFTRDDLNLFAAELNLAAADAQTALDRIYYWTRGQPYLSQKLARAISREQFESEVDAHVDRIVMSQLAGRAALHSEPHMSHIHREVTRDKKESEALLNLYGRIRKGVSVATDLGSSLQLHLIALGLLEIDDHGELRIRNRIYETVFTARWANENLPAHWRGPAVALAFFLVAIAVPFWYTQWLPSPYANVLTSPDVELETAETAWVNLRSFPGHAQAADNLFRSFLQERARAAENRLEISEIALLATELPAAGDLGDQLQSEFWDREQRRASRREDRDAALLAALEALVLATPQRRNRAATLVSDDYPLLQATLASGDHGRIIFNPEGLLLTAADSANVRQWSLTPEGLQRRDDWTLTALEVEPLVRRVAVDREGDVRRIGLSLNLSHPRHADLRLKLIAPSGKTVEFETGRDRSSSVDDIRITAAALAPFIGETLAGTWSLSVRDEAIGVSGRLVGWNLNLNSQGLVEDFQRGLAIPDPVEAPANSPWISANGRYAIARATQSDSARIWDLAFAKPLSAVAVNENERLVGVDTGARHMVTATLDTVHLWDVATGDLVATLPTGAASMTALLTGDGQSLFVQHRTDAETRLEVWSLDDAAIRSQLIVSGTPALVAIDANARRIAVADYDRAVRIWDIESGQLLSQIDVAAQPSTIRLAAGGDIVGIVYGESGASLWRVERPQTPLFERLAAGKWQLEFSPSGSRVIAGRPSIGYQVYRVSDGMRLGPPLGVSNDSDSGGLVAFSQDESIVVTGGPATSARFWRVPEMSGTAVDALDAGGHAIWSPAGDGVVTTTPDTSLLVIGDRNGHVHLQAARTGPEGIASASEDVSYLGHNDVVRILFASSNSQLVASAAADNTIRIWDAGSGLPKAFTVDIPGSPVSSMVFSRDSSRLLVLNGIRVMSIDVETGLIDLEIDLGENHNALTVTADGAVYVGSESGALSVLRQVGTSGWSVQRLWSGNSPIRHLQASPQDRFLVMVDAAGLARQFELGAGQIGDLSIELPSEVIELTFSPGGSRVLFRTDRWIHRASSSANGVTWVDALFIPDISPGARMAFGDDTTAAAMLGNRLYLPVPAENSLQLAELQLSAGSTPTLFGSREGLLAEWKARLSIPEPIDDQR